MSPKQGETPTPKRGPGRPRKTPEIISMPGDTPMKISAQELAEMCEKAREAGYREGWDAAQAKNRLPLFEAARKWGFEHAAQIAGFRTFLDADNAGLFSEIQAEYPDEKLIRSDRQLIFDQVKRHLRRKEALADTTVELSAGRKNELRRTTKDFEEIVVS